MLRSWREEHIRTLREEQPKALAGSLGEAIAGQLKMEAGRRRVDFEDLLTHWLVVFGDKPRLVITPKMIQDQLDQWHVEGVAASTLNHRRQALRTFSAAWSPTCATRWTRPGRLHSRSPSRGRSPMKS